MKSLLALLLAAAITACGVSAAPADPPASPDAGSSQVSPAEQPLPPESDPTPASVPSSSTLETMSEPPALTVCTLYDADEVSAIKFSYQWTTALPDGQAQSVTACGVSPLQALDGLESAMLYTAFRGTDLPPLAEGELPGSLVPVFTLKFDGPAPQSVTARRWKAEDIGESSSDDLWEENVEAVLKDGVWQLIPLGDGEFVYEVCADWGETGSATYGFRTTPQVRMCALPTAP